jgi:DNA-binding NtrC family response regulator
MFRLNVIPIYLPPLRERGDDIRLLAQHFVAYFAKEFRKPISRIDEQTYAKLAGYSWPGSVRELRNVTERAVLLSNSDTIGPDDIVLGRMDQPAPTGGDGLFLPPNGVNLHELESSLVLQALKRTNNNQTHAAKLLGLSRDALHYRMDKLGLLKT